LADGPEAPDGYRRAFAGFDPAVVAAFDVARLDTLVQDPGIIRHRAKIESTVTNARAVLAVAEEFGTFDAYVWVSSATRSSRTTGGKVRPSGLHAPFETAQRRPSPPRLPLRRPDGHLRAPPGCGAGAGPRHELLSLERARGLNQQGSLWASCTWPSGS